MTNKSAHGSAIGRELVYRLLTNPMHRPVPAGRTVSMEKDVHSRVAATFTLALCSSIQSLAADFEVKLLIVVGWEAGIDTRTAKVRSA